MAADYRGALAKLNRAKSTIKKAKDDKDLEALTKIQNEGQAIALLARRMGVGLEIQNEAALITLEARRATGEILSKIPREQGKRTDKTSIQSKAGYSEAAKTVGGETIARKLQAESSVPEDRFLEWVGSRKDEGKEITSAGLRNLAANIRRESMHESAREPKGAESWSFPLILADPPWAFGSANPDDGRADSHYPTMSTKDICELLVGGRPIKDVACEGAALFLWSTNAHIPDALRVIKAWGFEYKTNVVWVKPSATRSLGTYVRGQHEILLIATRGGFSPLAETKRPTSVINAPVSNHSEKPEEAYELIEGLYPGIKGLELFARKRRKGWNRWGLESQKEERPTAKEPRGRKPKSPLSSSSKKAKKRKKS